MRPLAGSQPGPPIQPSLAGDERYVNLTTRHITYPLHSPSRGLTSAARRPTVGRVPPVGWEAVMLNRRAFLTTGLGATLAAPLVARAQQPARVPRIGDLLGASPASSHPVEGFRHERIR